jgi:CheY-like chemotaxis protein
MAAARRPFERAVFTAMPWVTDSDYQQPLAPFGHLVAYRMAQHVSLSDRPGPDSSFAGCAAPEAGIPEVLLVGSYPDGDMYAEYLRTVGFDVVHARTPEQALAFVHKRPPAVIITDMVFDNSEYDGPTFVDEIRQRPDCTTTSVILVSGYIQVTDRRRARRAGADVFLMKPCAPAALSEYVASAIRAHHCQTRPEWNWPED